MKSLLKRRTPREEKDMDGKILLTGDFDLPAGYPSERIVHLRVPRDDRDIINHLRGVTHYIVGGPEYVHDAIMDAAPDLRHIVVMGTGTNSFVDVPAATARGIAVDNTPGINIEAVAEYALGMTICHLANSFHSRADLLAGGWYQKPHKTLMESKIGIIGMGNIGSQLARRLHAISAGGIAYFSRTRKPEAEQAYGLTYMDVPELLQKCDAVVMCVTYTPSTHELINADALRHARPDLVLLNFSNPLTIHPSGLKDALQNGQIRFAFFDGYYNEWIRNKGMAQDSYGLLALGPDKFVATSHIAAQTHDVIARILTEAFRKTGLWDRQNACRPQHGPDQGGACTRPFPAG
jgi:glyoxylate reductase